MPACARVWWVGVAWVPCASVWAPWVALVTCGVTTAVGQGAALVAACLRVLGCVLGAWLAGC